MRNCLTKLSVWLRLISWIPQRRSGNIFFFKKVTVSTREKQLFIYQHFCILQSNEMCFKTVCVPALFYLTGSATFISIFQKGVQWCLSLYYLWLVIGLLSVKFVPWILSKICSQDMNNRTTDKFIWWRDPNSYANAQVFFLVHLYNKTLVTCSDIHV